MDTSAFAEKLFAGWQTTTLLVTVLILTLLGREILGRRRRNPQGLPLPPGPPKLPLLGNMMQLSKLGLPWEAYTQWAKEYGELARPSRMCSYSDSCCR
jgi:hypothetical protein